MRKAHPEFAKQKKVRVKKPVTKRSTVSSASPLLAPNNSESDPFDTCHYCRVPFSSRLTRLCLCEHSQQLHPVQAVMEALLRRVASETEPPQDSASLAKSSKRPLPASLAMVSSFSSSCKILNPCFKRMKTHETEAMEVERGNDEHPPMTASTSSSSSVTSHWPKEKSERLPTVACTYCGKEITKKSIRAHVRNLHPEVATQAQGQWQDGDTGGGRPAASCPTTQCTFCGKIITKKSIRAHVRNLHPEAAAVGGVPSTAAVNGSHMQGARVMSDTATVPPKQQPHSQVVAGFSIQPVQTSASTLDVAGDEVLTINGRMQTVACQYCQLKVPQTEMLNHVKTVHARTRTSLCKYCPKLIQYRNMNTHVRKYHVVESVVEGLVSQVSQSLCPAQAHISANLNHPPLF